MITTDNSAVIANLIKENESLRQQLAEAHALIAKKDDEYVMSRLELVGAISDDLSVKVYRLKDK